MYLGLPILEILPPRSSVSLLTDNWPPCIGHFGTKSVGLIWESGAAPLLTEPSYEKSNSVCSETQFSVFPVLVLLDSPGHGVIVPLLRVAGRSDFGVAQHCSCCYHVVANTPVNSSHEMCFGPRDIQFS